MKTLIVIPARYESSRYPGKPLVELTGADGQKKSLVRRSWEAARKVSGIANVVVATDDDRIRRACEMFGANVVMTSSACANGTERCAETVQKLGVNFDVVINLQGDAPLTPSWFIESLVTALANNPNSEIATPELRCQGRVLNGLQNDRRAGRVGGTTAVFDLNKKGMYFSKEVIPFTSRAYQDDEPTPVFHHVGVYAYRPNALKSYPSWPTGPLEKLEGLEQLRFIEQGRSVLCVEVDARGRQFWELNNPQDVPLLEKMMADMSMN